MDDKFKEWFGLLSKIPYMSQEEIAWRAWSAALDSQWVSVSDKMPSEDFSIPLIVTNGVHTDIGFWYAPITSKNPNKPAKWMYNDEHGHALIGQNVTLWAPLLKIPSK